ncbi:MAG: arsenic efflux protein [Clostridia bacterium]|nr:arsenic efflux protein [Clostridia bacterium]
MWDVVFDAVLDSLKIFPFILLIYILMEIIENARNKESIERVLQGPFAPVIAGALGAVPECGFAAMLAKLYDKGLIKIGTLIAAFLSISDEGVIVLITGGAMVKDAAILVGVKMVYAILVGVFINILLAKKDAAHVCPEKGDCIECGEHHEGKLDKYFLHPLWHAAKILVYVLIINFLLGMLLEVIGEDALKAFMDGKTYFQPLFASLVGLIPNCGSSILLAQAFNDGILSFAGLIAGLSANSGIGILILLRSKKNFVKALLIIGLQFLCALAIGYIALGIFAL